MSMETVTEPASLRSENMAKRREEILFQARKMIAREGFEALKLRDLATRSGVTVPTIYNLIGGKPEILNLIIDELIEWLQAARQNIQTDDIEKTFEDQIDELARLFATDEDYFRAAFIAGDRNGLFEQSSPSGIFARSLRPIVDACRKARRAGLLSGGISAVQLGRQIYGSYRLARQDWVNGYLDLKAFRRQALTGVFLCLAADANDEFRARLTKRIRSLV